MLLLLGHKDVEDRRGEAAIVAAQGGIDQAAHHGVGRIVASQVSEPVAHRIAGDAPFDVHQQAVRLWMLGDAGELGLPQGFLDQRDDLGRQGIQGQIEPDPAPPLQGFATAAPEHGEALFEQVAVGDDDCLPVAGLDGGGTPVDLHHPALGGIHLQPVTDGDGVVELNGDPGQQVAQGVLHGEGDDRGDHRRGSDYLPERHAGGVEAKQTPADIADGDDDIGDDPRDPHMAEGEQKLEQQDPPYLDQYQASQQGGDLDQQLMGQRQFEPAPFQLDQQDHHRANHHETELGEQLPSLSRTAPEVDQHQGEGEQGPERVFANPDQRR